MACSRAALAVRRRDGLLQGQGFLRLGLRERSKDEFRRTAIRLTPAGAWSTVALHHAKVVRHRRPPRTSSAAPIRREAGVIASIDPPRRRRRRRKKLRTIRGADASRVATSRRATAPPRIAHPIALQSTAVATSHGASSIASAAPGFMERRRPRPRPRAIAPHATPSRNRLLGAPNVHLRRLRSASTPPLLLPRARMTADT